MFNAVAAFSGGLWVQSKLNDVALPKISRAVDEGDCFKLAVRVLSVSIPGLADPGVLTRERPRVEVVLGNSRKDTELGDFRPEGAWSVVSNHTGGSNDEINCPWSFGDTLTFVATHADVLGNGLQVWVRTQSDLRLGPLQLSLSQPTDVGMCSVDIRRTVLPACTPRPNGGVAGGNGISTWESQAILFPLTYVGSATTSAPPSERNIVLGESVGHVALIFSVDTAPVGLLKAVEDSCKPLVDRVANPLKEWSAKTAEAVAAPVRWVLAATEASCRSADQFDQKRPISCMPSHLCGALPVPRIVPLDPPRVVVVSPDLRPPEVSPDDWLSHTSPRSGRTFWHHKSLGPPPWSPVRGLSDGDTHLMFGLGRTPSTPSTARKPSPLPEGADSPGNHAFDSKGCTAFSNKLAAVTPVVRPVVSTRIAMHQVAMPAVAATKPVVVGLAVGSALPVHRVRRGGDMPAIGA